MRKFVFLLFCFCIISNLEISHAQLDSTYNKQQRDVDRIRKVQKQMGLRYDAMLSHYDSLVKLDEEKGDSLEFQKQKIQSLLEGLEQERLAMKMSQNKIDRLKKENEVLRSVMLKYVKQIDSLNTINRILIEEKGQLISTAQKYYYDLKKNKKSKIYCFYDVSSREVVFYWEVRGNPKKKTLETVVYDKKGRIVEEMNEIFTKEGSRLENYEWKLNSSMNFTDIEENQVYLWNSDSTYTLKMSCQTPTGSQSLEKKRAFVKIDSLEVLGQMKEVAVYLDKYTFYNSEQIEMSSTYKYSYYAEGIGCVQLETVKLGESYQLMIVQKILSKREFKKELKSIASQAAYK